MRRWIEIKKNKVYHGVKKRYMYIKRDRVRHTRREREKE